jgi:hypothetical protein
MALRRIDATRNICKGFSERPRPSRIRSAARCGAFERAAFLNLSRRNKKLPPRLGVRRGSLDYD